MLPKHQQSGAGAVGSRGGAGRAIRLPPPGYCEFYLSSVWNQLIDSGSGGSTEPSFASSDSWVDRRLNGNGTGCIMPATSPTQTDPFELYNTSTLVAFFDFYPSLQLAQWLIAFPSDPFSADLQTSPISSACGLPGRPVGSQHLSADGPSAVSTWYGRRGHLDGRGEVRGEVRRRVAG